MIPEDGVILFDKPAGITSHDVVASVRRRYGRGAKVGHAGTLDPFATGLLLVLVGRATRVQRFLMALPKRYETVARLGWTSTTGDPEGELAPGLVPGDPLVLPTGVLRQRPPAYSAVKIDGERAYARARRGEVVETAEREVTVTRFEQLWRDGERASFAIECSSGTYVRTLVSDLGDAYCLELRRTGIGSFDVDDASEERIVPLRDALGLPARGRAGARRGPPREPRRGRARRGGRRRPAHRRRRPDRPGRAATGRNTEARRRLPRLMDITWLPDARPRERHLAVGEFDGVHIGHREVIRGADTVLTFEPHPRAVVAPDSAPKLLTPLAIKADLIAELAVRELVVIPFDGSFAHQTAQEFIDRELIERLGARTVSVGENFRFGHKAKGDTGLLRAQDAFDTRVAELVELDGEIVSSTHIRGLVTAGEVDVARRFLGAPFQMRGTIVHGDKRGRTLGFPTANLVPDSALTVPGHGVYACRAQIGSDSYVAAVNVGVRPTFQTGRGLLVEAFLLDFSADVYGAELRLDFLERLRGERRFDDVGALVEQMHRDVDATRRIAA